jgi:hypothetical protein
MCAIEIDIDTDAAPPGVAAPLFIAAVRFAGACLLFPPVANFEGAAFFLLLEEYEPLRRCIAGRETESAEGAHSCDYCRSLS